jgi:hypothetical protein
MKPALISIRAAAEKMEVTVQHALRILKARQKQFPERRILHRNKQAKGSRWFVALEEVKNTHIEENDEFDRISKIESDIAILFRILKRRSHQNTPKT